MVKVMLATAAEEPWSRQLRAEVESVVQADRYGEHVLVADPEAADLILLLDAHQHLDDWRQQAIRRHPLVRSFADKVFVYDERDIPHDSLPGIYVAMPRFEYDERRHRAFAYYKLLNDTRSVASVTPDLLFSFQGRNVGPVRGAVLALSHPRAVVRDSSEHDFFAADCSALDDATHSYRELVGRSKFVLCPRGAGTSSLRLFEALAAGRVPVILSDEWVPPPGIDWDACSLRVRERDAAVVAGYIEAVESAWPALSGAARETYAEWFAPEMWFHRAVELCLELQRGGAAGTSRQWTRRTFWRDGARAFKRRLLSRT